MHIDSDRLRTLRKAQGLSRARLAERSRVSERTIQRWETGSGASRAVREHTLNQLAKVLRVEPDVLTGESPLPVSSDNPAPRPQSVQIGAQVAPKARLAYDLVRRRYGVTLTEVVNMAPLLFVLLAEGSLAWRRKMLEEADEAIGRLEGMQDQTGIGLFNISAGRATDASFHEQESIEKVDLFGTHLLESTTYWGVEPFDPSETNPFAGYLRKLANDLGTPDVVDVGYVGYVFAQNFPRYDICSADLDRIANGDDAGRLALQNGDARLSEIPQELMADDAGEKRAAWLADRLSDAWSELLTLKITLPEEQDKQPEAELEKRNAEEKGGDG